MKALRTKMKALRVADPIVVSGPERALGGLVEREKSPENPRAKVKRVPKLVFALSVLMSSISSLPADVVDQGRELSLRP